MSLGRSQISQHFFGWVRATLYRETCLLFSWKNVLLWAVLVSLAQNILLLLMQAMSFNLHFRESGPSCLRLSNLFQKVLSKMCHVKADAS